MTHYAVRGVVDSAEVQTRLRARRCEALGWVAFPVDGPLPPFKSSAPSEPACALGLRSRPARPRAPNRLLAGREQCRALDPAS